jgi:hypothetical protein
VPGISFRRWVGVLASDIFGQLGKQDKVSQFAFKRSIPGISCQRRLPFDYWLYLPELWAHTAVNNTGGTSRRSRVRNAPTISARLAIQLEATVL